MCPPRPALRRALRGVRYTVAIAEGGMAIVDPPDPAYPPIRALSKLGYSRYVLPLFTLLSGNVPFSAQPFLGGNPVQTPDLATLADAADQLHALRTSGFTSECVHHYVLGAPQATGTVGRCKLCGAEKTWAPDLVDDFRTARVPRRVAEDWSARMRGAMELVNGW